MVKQFISAFAVPQRLQVSVLGPYVEGFCMRLAHLGYRPASIKHKLSVVTGLAQWMAHGHVAVVDLDEARLDEFVAAQRHRGRTCRGFHRTVLVLLDWLRSAGTVPTRVTAFDDSPMAAQVRRYEAYLQSERALAKSTIVAYSAWVRSFIAERLDAGAARPGSLTAHDVRDFLLARVGHMAPRRVQAAASALRSFLRHLFLHGDTQTDLRFAIPTVRQGPRPTVPRHLAAEDVERLLQACNRSSATGRRDYALLLLIARLGLRASEVIALELGDLRWREAEIIVRGKGLVRDRLPLPADVGESLALYLKERLPVDSRRVFLCMRAPQRGFAHPSTVTTIVMRALARSGLTPATRGAHLLRHSLATAMVRKGASLAEIGQVLRHRSPNTTEIYAKLDFDALRDVAMPWPTKRGAR